MREWPLVVTAVQWTLNSRYRERLGTTPFQLMSGCCPQSGIMILAGENAQGRHLDEVVYDF